MDAKHACEECYYCTAGMCHLLDPTPAVEACDAFEERECTNCSNFIDMCEHGTFCDENPGERRRIVLDHLKAGVHSGHVYKPYCSNWE